MAGLNFTPEDHARVTAAVAAAENSTDGEIVTIVSDRSDSYHDVALHYAVAAMLLLAAASAVFPAIVEMKLAGSPPAGPARTAGCRRRWRC
ncbi:MAG: hypothetical protein WDN24_00090 [Sphingomonas sp.]